MRDECLPKRNPARFAGPELEVDPVSAEVQGLLAGVTYHFKVLAENEKGKEEGKVEITFTTRGTGAFALPDGRSWEMVSPPEKNGSLLEPIGTEGPIQAAADGTAITYLADAPVESEPGGYGGDAQILSTRADTGDWQSLDLALPHRVPVGVTAGAGGEYRMFSETSLRPWCNRLAPSNQHCRAKPLNRRRIFTLTFH